MQRKRARMTQCMGIGWGREKISRMRTRDEMILSF